MQLNAGRCRLLLLAPLLVLLAESQQPLGAAAQRAGGTPGTTGPSSTTAMLAAPGAPDGAQAVELPIGLRPRPLPMVFLHVPKTGGTSLALLFHELMAEANCTRLPLTTDPDAPPARPARCRWAHVFDAPGNGRPHDRAYLLAAAAGTVPPVELDYVFGHVRTCVHAPCMRLPGLHARAHACALRMHAWGGVYAVQTDACMLCMHVRALQRCMQAGWVSEEWRRCSRVWRPSTHHANPLPPLPSHHIHQNCDSAPPRVRRALAQGCVERGALEKCAVMSTAALAQRRLPPQPRQVLRAA
jgi:hypothetical protein